jgi:cyclic-di-AMP phosphodiesterase PgpH
MILSRSGQKKPRRPGQGPRPGLGAVSSRQRRLQSVAVAAAFVVLVAATVPFLGPAVTDDQPDIDFGAVAPKRIKAEFAFPTVDLRATRVAQDEAAAKVPGRYRADRARVDDLLAGFRKRCDAILAQRGALEKRVRAALLESDPAQPEGEVVDAATLAFATELSKKDDLFKTLGEPALLAEWLRAAPQSVPTRIMASAPQGEAGAGAAQTVKGIRNGEAGPLSFAQAEGLAGLAGKALEYVLTDGVMAQGDAAKERARNDSERSIVVLRDWTMDGQKKTEVYPLAEMPVSALALESLQERIALAAEEQSNQETDAPRDWERLKSAAFAMARLDLDATLAFDRPATEEALETARGQVEPQMKTVPRGGKIQEDGEPWAEQTISDYKTHQRLKQEGQEPIASATAVLVAHMILVGLVLAAQVRSLSLLTRRRHQVFRNLSLSLLVMCGILVTGRLVSFFDPSGLLVPAPAGAILLAILTNGRLAAMNAVLTSSLLSVQYDHDWRLLVVSGAMSFAGVFSIFMVRRRSDMGSAAFKATFVGLLALAAITLATDTLLTEAAFRRLALVAINGMACLLFVPGLLPPLERLFNITTDIQLLEYSDLNNELLSRLAIEVPATHAHSQRLGQLADEAAKAIGANGLLSRVCAYYHDIGKLRRPEYFTENQNGQNVHDDLSPRLSARAIKTHVVEGVEMAREYHLPTPIIDGILEHHGTMLISFFYQEAVAQQKHGDVNEADFRYPGPKPRSRETAILMICDAAESGVRSIKNPNEERVREFVDKIIATRAADRQFDECDLTLKDLDTIASVVTKSIVGTLHRRVAYPDHAPEKPAANVISMSGGNEP